MIINILREKTISRSPKRSDIFHPLKIFNGCKIVHWSRNSGFLG